MTFMQLCATKTIDVLLPYLNQHYTEKLAALTDSDVVFSSNVVGYAYEVHDMKMFHILYGKEAWNCNNDGYLFCSCSRKEGVMNNCSEECTLVSDEEHLKYDTDARREWKELQEKYPDKDEVELKLIFHKWCQTHTNGFNGFGVEARLLPIYRARSDVFHQVCGITRTMLRYLRHLLAKCSVFVMESFHKKLASFLTSTQNVMWRSKDPLSIFRGKDLFKFIDNAKELAKWAETEELCGKKSISWTNF